MAQLVNNITDPIPPRSRLGESNGDREARFRVDYPGQVTDYEVRSRYFRDGSTYLLGCASPRGFRGVSAAVVQLTAPTVVWVADWTAECTGAQPLAPSPLLLLNRELRTPAVSRGSTTWVLMDEHLEAPQIRLEGDGATPIYRLSGVYVFAALNPRDDLAEEVRFPQPPYMRDGLPRAYDPNFRVQGII